VKSHPRRRVNQLSPKLQRFNVWLLLNVFNIRDIVSHLSVVMLKLQRMLLMNTPNSFTIVLVRRRLNMHERRRDVLHQ